MTESFIGFAVLLAMVFLRVPIAIALLIVGFFGFGLVISFQGAMALVAQITFTTAFTYELSVVPLFVLMGNFVNRAGLSKELYDASNAFLGHRRGGLAMATVVACGGFSAICGSSLATAATMSKVAMPSMRRYGYADSLASGSIAAGGTLGILIPPSVVLVIYGILTESDIGALFAAGIVPGLIGILFYLGAVQYAIARRPEIGPRGERVAWPERWRALRGVWGVLVLFVVVMGGIYLGIFTPTEAAGIGASFSFLFLLLRTRLTPRFLRDAAREGRLLKASLHALATWRDLREVLAETAYTTAMIFTVLIGALLFAEFVNVAGLPSGLIGFIEGLDVHPYTVIVVIVLIYLVLGCVFESLSMLLLTIPVLFPIVDALGFNLIWFGIVAVVVTEISLITPPIGLNVFVLRAVLPDVETKTIFKGVTPFWIADIFRLAVLVAVPWFSLALPRLFFNIG